MALELPKEFKNVPLGHLWEYLKIANELKELAETADEKKYWTGWHDCMANLLGDLTSRPVIKTEQELARLFEDFRMEDQLIQMEEDYREENGYGY